MAAAVRPIFVVGSPRSGTTMLGSWLGSAPHSYDIGEYNAFYLTHRTVRREMAGLQQPWWAPHLEEYVNELKEHAARFVVGVTEREGCDTFVDSSPRNLLVADELAERFPTAIFVLALRHFSGVVQSLSRTGWPWVPASIEGKAAIWREHYSATERLPLERTAAVSYDRLCAAPEETMRELELRLGDLGIDTSELDRTMLGYSHAHVLGRPRQTLLDQQGAWQSIASFDATSWSPAVHMAALPQVRAVDALLQQRFSQYAPPLGWTERQQDGGVREQVDELESAASPTVAGVQFVVDDAERAREFFVDLLGFPLAGRVPHPAVDAEVIMLAPDGAAVNLLHPTDVGDRPPFGLPEPRLAQLSFGVAAERFARLQEQLVEAGVAVVQETEGVFYIPEEFMHSVFGAAPVLVFVRVDADRVQDEVASDEERQPVE